VQLIRETLSPGIKRSRREADHSHPVPGLRMLGDIPPLHHTLRAVVS